MFGSISSQALGSKVGDVFDMKAEHESEKIILQQR